MASLIEIPSMSHYPDVVQHVITHGKSRSPRGIETLDAGIVTVVLKDPTKGLALGCGRGLSPRVAAAEAVQLIGAFHDPDLMVWASPGFARFQDEPGGLFHGAYGIRIGRQMSHVVTKLLLDASTRQAVVTIWNPLLDNQQGKKDYPCTVSLVFSIIDDRLEMITVMRSNDVWLGFPYDVFQFTQLQLTLASILGIEVGSYTHIALSMHLYVTNLEATGRLAVHSTFFQGDVYQPQGLGQRLDTLDRVMFTAPQLVYTDRPDIPGREMTESEEWYHRQFDGFRRALATDPPHLGPDVAGGR